MGVEINRLKSENDVIQNDIHKLKHDLRFYEVQNGVKHIPIPKRIQPEAQTVVQEAPPVSEPPKKEAKKEKAPKKKEKTENKAGSGKGQTKAADDKPIDASRLNMKVGKIVSVKRHPDADSLYVEQVDLGEEKPRTIVSGLVKHVPINSMRDRYAVFFCNLKPAKMRGILSEGMIMCASGPEKVEILVPPPDSAVGD